MAYTQTDLDNIDIAIAEFQSGRRAERVMLGDKMIQYAAATLADLERRRVIIQNEISAGIGRKTCFRTATSKGL